MPYSLNELVNLANKFEELTTIFKTKSSNKIAAKRKLLTELERLEEQLRDAKRQGDKDWADELKDRIKELKK